MQAFELHQLISQQQSSQKLYLEFLRVLDLSMGLYVLPTGGTGRYTGGLSVFTFLRVRT